MVSFSGYKFVIYDANCIIYYCFRTEHASRKGPLVVIDSPPFTDITRNLTQYLIKKNIKIRTILVIFSELTEDVLSSAIKVRISDEQLRKDLGLARGEKFPEDIEYKLNRNIKKKIKNLRYESWFELDDAYGPNFSQLAALRIFFKEKAFFAENKGMPHYNDMTLILYSKDTMQPLVSNDGHIHDLKDDLQKEGYAHKIIPLMECKQENLN